MQSGIAKCFKLPLHIQIYIFFLAAFFDWSEFGLLRERLAIFINLYSIANISLRLRYQLFKIKQKINLNFFFLISMANINRKNAYLSYPLCPILWPEAKLILLPEGLQKNSSKGSKSTEVENLTSLFSVAQRRADRIPILVRSWYIYAGNILKYKKIGKYTLSAGYTQWINHVWILIRLQKKLLISLIRK